MVRIEIRKLEYISHNSAPTGLRRKTCIWNRGLGGGRSWRGNGFVVVAVLMEPSQLGAYKHQNSSSWAQRRTVVSEEFSRLDFRGGERALKSYRNPFERMTLKRHVGQEILWRKNGLLIQLKQDQIESITEK